jgi:hypothetical protein
MTVDQKFDTDAAAPCTHASRVLLMAPSLLCIAVCPLQSRHFLLDPASATCSGSYMMFPAISKL